MYIHVHCNSEITLELESILYAEMLYGVLYVIFCNYICQEFDILVHVLF